MADEPWVQSVKIEPHPAGAGFGLHAQIAAIGNFGRPRTITRLLPQRFQTIEAARTFALGELELDPRRIQCGVQTTNVPNPSLLSGCQPPLA